MNIIDMIDMIYISYIPYDLIFLNRRKICLIMQNNQTNNTCFSATYR